MRIRELKNFTQSEVGFNAEIRIKPKTIDNRPWHWARCLPPKAKVRQKIATPQNSAAPGNFQMNSNPAFLT